MMLTRLDCHDAVIGAAMIIRRAEAEPDAAVFRRGIASDYAGRRF